MAGHSKRHNIKHHKAKQDAKKSKIYAKVAKTIQMAAKDGDDPDLNPKLDTALQKAKEAGLPKDVIQRAIDKGAGNVEGEELEEIYYEGYGPGGIALYIKCVTSNTNRTGAQVRAILTKFGSSLGEPGSVARQFTEKGVIAVGGKVREEQVKGKKETHIDPLPVDEFELALLETQAQDWSIDENTARVVTSKDDFFTTNRTLKQGGWHITDAELERIAENEISLDERDEEKLKNLIEQLDDDDDVDTVFHNAA